MSTATGTTPRRIVSLEVQNVKRISAVFIAPTTNSVLIGGENGAGKSSILDAIEMTLLGADSIPSRPIRNGQTRASAKLDLGDLLVERIFTASGSTVTVKSKDGAKYGSPQAMLDKLCSRIAFDPLAFSRLKAKEQLEQIKKLVGLDFTAQDAERAKLFADRTEVNRGVKAAQQQLASLAHDASAPAEEVSAAELMAELQRRERANAANRLVRQDLSDAETEEETILDDIREIEAKIAGLQADLLKSKASLEQHRAYLKEKSADVAKLVDADEAEVRGQLATIDKTNAAVRQNKQRAAVAKRLAEVEGQSTALTTKIDAIDTAKQQAMEAAKFPVAGLGFDAAGVTFNGLPFEQSSSAEKLRVSVAMGFEMNPQFPVALIRDGSLLDDNSLKLVDDLAAEYGGQVWLERVGTGGPVSVVIEDGHVRGAEPASLPADPGSSLPTDVEYNGQPESNGHAETNGHESNGNGHAETAAPPENAPAKPSRRPGEPFKLRR